MSALLLCSIALVIGSLIGSVVIWIRSGETRVGMLGGLLVVFVAHQGIELWSHWGMPFAIDASGATAIAGLLEGLLSVGLVIALSRTLGERDRVEAIHWDSMEAVRVMNELSTDAQMPFEAKIEKLLKTGRKRFGMEVAMFSRVSNECFEVLAIDSAQDFPVACGSVFPLSATHCEATIESERPVAVERIADSTWIGPTSAAAFEYEAYLGAAVRVGGFPYGTLSFASSQPRKDRFTGTDKDLIRLMAQWLGTEIERRDGVHAYIEEPLSNRTATESQTSESDEAPENLTAWIVGKTSPRPPRRPPTPAQNPGELNANKMLQRVENQLRTALGDEITLDLKLDPGLGLAAVSRVPIDAIVRTLVMNARDAMADRGELVIETANLELLPGEPGVIPAVAPDRYVTIAVRHTGSEPDADTLARLYEPEPTAHDSVDIRDPRARLTLSIIYRLLQSCGGDLSVEVEKGRGSTFTVYLPRAEETPIGVAPRSSHSRSGPTLH